MNHYHYKKTVVEQAVKQYRRPVCTDSIDESYRQGLSIDEAVEQVILDSEYFDYPGYENPKE